MPRNLLTLLLLFAACSAGIRPVDAGDPGVDAGSSDGDGGPGDSGVDAGWPSEGDAGSSDAGLPVPSCGPWTASANGSVLGTNVRGFSAADDLVVFATAAGRIVARKLASGLERELFNMTPASQPSQGRVLVLVLSGSVGLYSSKDLRALDLEDCSFSPTIGTSQMGPTPSGSYIITEAAICGSGYAFVTNQLIWNRLSVSGIAPVSSPDRSNFNVTCTPDLLIWESIDAASGDPSFLNWARTDGSQSARRQFTQSPTARLDEMLPYSSSSRWTVWAENVRDGGAELIAVENATLWDGGASLPLVPIFSNPSGRLSDIGVRGDLATWHERSATVDRLVVRDLQDGGVSTRNAGADTQHAIVEQGVILLSGGVLTWDPGFHP